MSALRSCKRKFPGSRPILPASKRSAARQTSSSRNSPGERSAASCAAAGVPGPAKIIKLVKTLLSFLDHYSSVHLLDIEWLLSTLFDASLLKLRAAGNGGSFFTAGDLHRKTVPRSLSVQPRCAPPATMSEALHLRCWTEPSRGAMVSASPGAGVTNKQERGRSGRRVRR